METLGSYLTRTNTKRLNKIRSKKTKILKKPLGIFSCLVPREELEVKKTEKVIVNPDDKRNARIKRRLTVVQKRWDGGGVMKLKHLQRYKRFAEELHEEVPEGVLKLLEEMESKSFKSKKKKEKKKNRKRKPKKYDTYINGVVWEKRKNAYYKLHGRTCAVCGSVKFIHPHHKYYGEYGEEKDEHLVPLCQDHHKQFHDELGKTKKDMVKETDSFIERYRPA